MSVITNLSIDRNTQTINTGFGNPIRVSGKPTAVLTTEFGKITLYNIRTAQKLFSLSCKVCASNHYTPSEIAIFKDIIYYFWKDGTISNPSIEILNSLSRKKPKE